MAKGRMSGTHGTTSPEQKMSHYSTKFDGDSAERWQKDQGVYVEPGSVVKQTKKHRAKKKRRSRDAHVIRQELDNE